MKRMIVSVAMMMAFGSLYAQGASKTGKVVIEGTLLGDLKGHSIMYTYTRMGMDSAEIKNGHYRFGFPFAGTTLKMLLPQYVTKEGQMYRPFGILIDGPGTYYVSSDIAKGMTASVLKGPEGMMLYHDFEKDQDEAYKKINGGLQTRYGNNWWQIDEKDPRYAAKQAFNDSLQDVYLGPLLEKLLRQHPDSYASAFVLAAQGQHMGSVDRQMQLFNMLSDRMQQSEQGKKFYDFIQGEKNSTIGSTVANFTLPDPQDKPLDFDQFKGKYVMIDFWASWCSPCRKSFPAMRELYKQYKEKGFEIYSISIDENKKAWLKAVGEENNPWLQVLDNKDVAHQGFAITGVPTTYLIDPQGKIVAKQVGFDPETKGPVEEKLAAIFGSSTAPAAPAKAQPEGDKKVIKATRMSGM